MSQLCAVTLYMKPYSPNYPRDEKYRYTLRIELIIVVKFITKPADLEVIVIIHFELETTLNDSNIGFSSYFKGRKTKQNH